MNWDKIVKRITPHIVKIETQSGYGTGFLSLYNENKILCGVATSMHVVSHADEWQQPIRIRHYFSGVTDFLEESNCIIFKNQDTDSAVIYFRKAGFPLPEDPIPVLPSDSIIDIGVEVG